MEKRAGAIIIKKMQGNSIKLLFWQSYNKFNKFFSICLGFLVLVWVPNHPETNACTTNAFPRPAPISITKKFF